MIIDKNVQMERSAFKFSQDTNSIVTFNTKLLRNDRQGDSSDIETVPGDDTGDMSKMTKTDTSMSTKATDITATYKNMQRTMIGLEQLIRNGVNQTRTDSDQEDRTLSLSVTPLSHFGVTDTSRG